MQAAWKWFAQFLQNTVNIEQLAQLLEQRIKEINITEISHVQLVAPTQRQ